jgi:hypothetical protein
MIEKFNAYKSQLQTMADNIGNSSADPSCLENPRDEAYSGLLVANAVEPTLSTLTLDNLSSTNNILLASIESANSSLLDCELSTRARLKQELESQLEDLIYLNSLLDMMDPLTSPPCIIDIKNLTATMIKALTDQNTNIDSYSLASLKDNIANQKNVIESLKTEMGTCLDSMTTTTTEEITTTTTTEEITTTTTIDLYADIEAKLNQQSAEIDEVLLSLIQATAIEPHDACLDDVLELATDTKLLVDGTKESLRDLSVDDARNTVNEYDDAIIGIKTDHVLCISTTTTEEITTTTTTEEITSSTTIDLYADIEAKLNQQSAEIDEVLLSLIQATAIEPHKACLDNVLELANDTKLLIDSIKDNLRSLELEDARKTVNDYDDAILGVHTENEACFFETTTTEETTTIDLYADIEAKLQQQMSQIEILISTLIDLVAETPHLACLDEVLATANDTKSAMKSTNDDLRSFAIEDATDSVNGFEESYSFIQMDLEVCSNTPTTTTTESPYLPTIIEIGTSLNTLMTNIASQNDSCYTDIHDMLSELKLTNDNYIKELPTTDPNVIPKYISLLNEILLPQLRSDIVDCGAPPPSNMTAELLMHQTRLNQLRTRVDEALIEDPLNQCFIDLQTSAAGNNEMINQVLGSLTGDEPYDSSMVEPFGLMVDQSYSEFEVCKTGTSSTAGMNFNILFKNNLVEFLPFLN